MRVFIAFEHHKNQPRNDETITFACMFLTLEHGRESLRQGTLKSTIIQMHCAMS